ncbi:MAG: aldose 1-epimerase [Bacteroidales bacterium]|nr:aldose 1-epimerase [Bacteroidales bacterium]
MNIEKTNWHGLDAILLETNVYEAILVPSVGANMIRLFNKEKEVDILRSPTSNEIETFFQRPQIFGIPVLFPPNRIEDGTYSFNGKKYSFPITIPAQNNYHHGILKSQPFVITRTEITTDAVEIEAKFFSNRVNATIYSDFPHQFICTMKYRLTDEGLTQTASFTNLSADPMPIGVGYHTPLCVPFSENSSKDDYKLLISAGKRWELSDRGLPTGNLLDLSAEETLLRQEGITPTGKGIEWALTDEAIFVDGAPYHGAVLIDTRTKLRLFYEVDEQFKHWTFWNNGGDVDWACPEPQTWAINAPNLNLPDGITGFQSIEPGETWSGTTKLYVK